MTAHAKTKAVAPKSTSTSPILADAAYPLDVFSAASGMKDWSLRQARRHGLRVIYTNGRGWVLGRDWIAYLEKQGTTNRESDGAS